uniref:Prokineticin 1 n=1 Tax=Anser cygnoides TaxID=8845 RepID=A0A8B9DEU9_ANSCY
FSVRRCCSLSILDFLIALLLAHECKACERDLQCGSGTCCAVSLWLRGLRMCTPLGQQGDECHPFSHKVPGGGPWVGETGQFRDVPFLGKRQHHTCPCLPNFICSRFLDGRYRCRKHCYKLCIWRN